MSARLRPSWVFLLIAAGCGRAYAPPAEAPGAASPQAPAEESAPTSAAPTDLDALEHELAVSEQRLRDYLVNRESQLRARVEASEVAIGDESDGESKTTEAQRGSARAPASKPAPSKKDRADDSPASGAAAPAGPPPSPAAAPEPESFSACDLACRAFSSMRRSAERICEIAGAADARCTRARSRVEEASERIERARCACRDD